MEIVNAFDQEINEANRNLRFVWTTYMSWYALMNTLNLAALAVIAPSDSSSINLIPVALTFIVFNFLAISTTIVINRFSAQTVTKIEGLMVEKWSCFKAEKNRVSKHTLTSKFRRYVCIANVVGSTTFILMWSFLSLFG